VKARISVPTGAVVYDLPLRHRFRGLDRRQGMVWETPAGWTEWSPFPEYGPAEAAVWLRAAAELAERGWPAPVRTVVPVNVTIPAVGPDVACRLAAESGCRTAKVKVAERGQSLGDDLARVEAVRAALGPAGRLRVDANGAWDVDTAERALRALNRFDLEYAEQPCATVPELAELRRRVARHGILIAADESIRRSGDPEKVVAAAAADIAILKVQPLGGIWRCLELAERLGLPVVVSSALESSIGLAAGLALAAALPELPYACGLNTARLLAADVGEPLVATGGALPARPGWQAASAREGAASTSQNGVLTAAPYVPDPARLASVQAAPALAKAWRQRLAQAQFELFRDS
jgi:O-succinylbenzoate synthase